MSCRPGHAPRHPDFVAGNTAHLVHGADSPRAIAARAEEVHEELLRYAPWVDQPHYLPTVHRYLQAAAREALLHEFIAKVSDEQGVHKVPVRTWEQVTAAARLAHSMAGDLGLTPMGEAKLRAIAGSATATELSIADLQERGAQIRANAKARNAAAAAAQVAQEALDTHAGTEVPGGADDDDR